MTHISVLEGLVNSSENERFAAEKAAEKDQADSCEDDYGGNSCAERIDKNED
jgi:hypothetical protein